MSYIMERRVHTALEENYPVHVTPDGFMGMDWLVILQKNKTVEYTALKGTDWFRLFVPDKDGIDM